MATYGGAADDLFRTVRARKRQEYGFGAGKIQGPALNPELENVDPFTGEAPASLFAPPEAGGFTGGEQPTDPAAPPPLEVPPAIPPGLAPVVEMPMPPAAPVAPSPAPAAPVPPEVPAFAPAAPAAPAPSPAVVDPMPTGNALSEAFRSALMQRLNTPVGASITDPALAAQSQAYEVGQTRARDRGREAIAERLAANGISDSGALDAGVAGLYQAQGENQAGFNAKLVGDDLARQRQELTDYMQMAGSQLNAEESRALQTKLADIDAQLRQQSITNQANQAGVDAELRRQGITNQNTQFLTDAELRRLGLTNQSNQFNQTQNWNENIWQYLANMYPQTAVMGGGA